MRRRRTVLLWPVLVLAAAASVPRGAAAAVYTFSGSNEGWQIVDFPFLTHVTNPAVASLPYDGAFGNPAGSVRIGDVFAETGIGAPAALLGNQLGVYGDSLRYDIFIRETDDVAYPAVVLNGGPVLSIYYLTPSPPLNQWQSRAIPLTEAGWKVHGTDANATKVQFKSVLMNLTGVYIATEWKTGPDDTSIDNIQWPVGSLVGVDDPVAATGPALAVPRPNPAAMQSALAFTLPSPAAARLEVLDAAGRHVRTLFAGDAPAGTSQHTWDGRDDAGRRAARGLYFVRLTLDATGHSETRKLVLI